MENAWKIYLATSCMFVAALLPHIFYYLVWTKSKEYTRLISKIFKNKVHPVDAFATTASVIKLIQLVSLIGWILAAFDPWIHAYTSTNASKGVLVPLPIPSLSIVIVSLIFIILGQVLNISIYHAIGKPGVYYGIRLGVQVPWYHGFPFNVGISHPQYVGSVLTVFGVLILLWDMLNSVNGTARVVLPWLAAFWTVCYVFTGYVEDNF